MEPLIAELKILDGSPRSGFEAASEAAARGFELEDIDADGDGNIDFQEFCTYFGRPNATYARTFAQANDSAKLNGKGIKMPMKQHVRIVGGHGRSVGSLVGERCFWPEVEMSMDQIRKSHFLRLYIYLDYVLRSSRLRLDSCEVWECRTKRRS